MMSSPSAANPSETLSKKSEEPHVNSKSDINPDEGVKTASPSPVKTETPAQTPVANGALPEIEKVNGLEVNGQDEKPSSDGLHREVPDLLPLGTVAPSPSSLQSSSPNPPARQPPPLLLPMNPVVATKSAPPPRAAGKTRGRTSSPASITSSPAKAKSSPTLRSKTEEPTPEKETKKRKVVTKKRHSAASSDSTEKGDGDSGDGRKSTRNRTRTQPFQSAEVDASLLRVIKQSAAAQAIAAAQKAKEMEEKLVVFFKGEFLAVRNAEGGFYICQAIQNINRGSHKIRIRWLSQQPAKEEGKGKRKPKTPDPLEVAKDETGFDIYTPDFYDHTDFECILTNLELEKFGKDRYGLPLEERTRTENILRRAIEVEQGVVDKLEVTEEHPDGLDVSLFHDESQLKRKRRQGKKTDDSSSDSDSESKEEIATTSTSSTKSRSAEPEPRTSTSGVASTSSGRGGTKRTRAAAVATARQKIQQLQRYQDDDDSTDDDAEEEEDESSSEDSDAGKRKRGRVSPKRSRAPPPKAKPKPKAPVSTRSTRGKNLVQSPKKNPIPIIMKRTKASIKQVSEVNNKRRKVVVAEVEEDAASPAEKVVTVDVEMGESTAEDEPKEIKLDAVMAVETEPETKAEKEAEPEKKVEPEAKSEPKDNDKEEVKDAKNEPAAKVESKPSKPKEESAKPEERKEGPVAEVKE